MTKRTHCQWLCQGFTQLWIMQTKQKALNSKAKRN